MAGEQLSTGGARVVDPVLTNVARGYRNPMAIYEHLFPVVQVGQRGGNVIEFGAEDFIVEEVRRAPGADMPRMDVGYKGNKYATDQRAIEVPMPVELEEEATAVPGIALGNVAAMRGKGFIDLQVENAAAALATTSVNFGGTSALAGTNQWSHADSKPSAAVNTAKETIRGKIGMNPNVLAVGEAVHDQLVNNAHVIDRVKHVMAANAQDIDEALLARYFGVDKYVVGRCRKGKPGAFSALWGKVAALVYSNLTPLASMGSPSWGYTYRLSGYPLSERPYYDERSRSWIYPHLTEDTPVVAGKDGGYLFTAVVA